MTLTLARIWLLSPGETAIKISRDIAQGLTHGRKPGFGLL